MPILVREKGGTWERAKDVEFANEAELQKMLYESPELLTSHDEQPAVFTREAGLPGSGSTDLLGVDADGNVLIVETKLAKNPEIRRKVIGQILEYAAHLWGMSYQEFDDFFQKKEGKSILDLLRARTSSGLPDGFRENVSANLESGSFHLFIAVDDMNDDLEKIVNYISSCVTGLKLQVIELRTYRTDQLEILAPQRHGEFVQPLRVTPTITLEQALANCPEDHSRQLFTLAVNLWKELGHEVKPGTVGVAFRANVSGTMQSIFWASRGDLQGAFGLLEKNGAPGEAVQQFRLAASRLRGFDSNKWRHDLSPIVKLANLNESEIHAFVEESGKLVQTWGNASDLQKPSASKAE